MKNLQVAVNAYSIYKYIHTYLNCTENMCMKIRSVTKSQFSPSNAALFCGVKLLLHVGVTIRFGVHDHRLVSLQMFCVCSLVRVLNPVT
jgi:hypothetical protein